MNKLGDRSLLITWMPHYVDMPGPSFYVNYSQEGTNRWHQTSPSFLPSFHVVLENLLLEKTYHLQIYSKDNGKVTGSDVKTVILRSNASLLHEPIIDGNVSVDISGAVWYIAILSTSALLLLIIFVLCVCYRNRGHKYAVAIDRSEIYTYESPGRKKHEDEEDPTLEYDLDKKENLYTDYHGASDFNEKLA
uniref:Fibronectin type-III domain-containing protein n=1 Tax=Romanomermis culicivorax TaxID=13658 RepID=A0A915KLN8_ROMCU